LELKTPRFGFYQDSPGMDGMTLGLEDVSPAFGSVRDRLDGQPFGP
jgi:hypothetical protein